VGQTLISTNMEHHLSDCHTWPLPPFLFIVEEEVSCLHIIFFGGLRIRVRYLEHFPQISYVASLISCFKSCPWGELNSNPNTYGLRWKGNTVVLAILPSGAAHAVLVLTPSHRASYSSAACRRGHRHKKSTRWVPIAVQGDGAAELARRETEEAGETNEGQLMEKREGGHAVQGMRNSVQRPISSIATVKKSKR